MRWSVRVLCLKGSHLELTCCTLGSWQHSVGRIHFSCTYAVIKFMSGESPSWNLGVISWLRRKRFPSNRCKIISQHPNIHPSGRAHTRISTVSWLKFYMILDCHRVYFKRVILMFRAIFAWSASWMTLKSFVFEKWLANIFNPFLRGLATNLLGIFEYAGDSLRTWTGCACVNSNERLKTLLKKLYALN